ncbi:MAG: DUF6174 domain-containing protein [Acidimicrobiales bacterium]
MPQLDDELSRILQRGDAIRRRRLRIASTALIALFAATTTSLLLTRHDPASNVAAGGGGAPSTTTVRPGPSVTASPGSTTTPTSTTVPGAPPPFTPPVPDPGDTEPSTPPFTTAPPSTEPESPTTTQPPNVIPPSPGPTVTGSTGSWGALQAALDAARLRWAANRPAGGYLMGHHIYCFCPPSPNSTTNGPDPSHTYTTNVDAGGTTTTTETNDGVAADPWNVDSQLADIQNRINQNVASVSASFDTTYGFVVSYSVDESLSYADDTFQRVVDWFSPH